MRQLLAVAVLGSILSFTASAALAEGQNADPKFFQFSQDQDQTATSTTDTASGMVAGPDTLQPMYVNNHEK